METEATLYLTPKQTLAKTMLDDPDVEDVMYGGAKGGGKSYFGCTWSYLHALKLIEECKITSAMKFPIPIGFLGRKRASDFTKTTLETWKRAIPGNLYTIRQNDKEIVIQDKVKLMYGGLDDQNTINKFNSAENAFIFIDQAEEIDRTDLAMLKGTLRLIINGFKPAYKVLLTSNPAPSFLRQDYIERPGPKTRFIRALPTDNPYLDAGYVPRLRDAFKHRPELIRAYVEGSWDDLGSSDILIKHSWCLSCINITLPYKHDRRVTSADPAHLGDDEFVIYNMIDGKIVSELIFGQKDAIYGGAKIVEMAVKNNSDIIAIDCDGLGGPVADYVDALIANNVKDKPSQMKLQVMRIKGAATPEREADYVNARSEMWFHAANQLAEMNCSLPDDPSLIGELCAVKYNPNGQGGRLQIEPKKEIKKRLDKSPDRADAFVYGIWATSKVAKQQYDFGRQETEQAPRRHDGYGWQQHQDQVQSIQGWSRYGA